MNRLQNVDPKAAVEVGQKPCSVGGTPRPLGSPTSGSTSFAALQQRMQNLRESSGSHLV